ncbi:alkaline phosphatase family protein [Nocardioides panacis]|uniref:Alkaline phosphatase family protein n=1 Tax=Nocardioides panacis TaxID=2849501 RepID=A0A975SYF0_9ACTN|nr:alkaline phosphatase family protein [Nocardioides panacis]QWZ08278.1 alkaline phosphatase family protein [Nocardioides panacis]
MPSRRLLTRTPGLALAVTLTTACAVGADTSTAGPRSADDPVDYVVAISVDGLNPDAIRELGAGGTPALHRMIAQGATTLNARSAYERTITLPNHTGMVTGRQVTGAGGHRVTFNDDNGSTLHRTAGGYVASMFDVAHDRGRATAFYSAKHKFDLLNRSWDAGHGAVDRVGANDGRDKIDRYTVSTEAANVTRLLGRLRSAPRRAELRAPRAARPGRPRRGVHVADLPAGRAGRRRPGRPDPRRGRRRPAAAPARGRRAHR